MYIWPHLQLLRLADPGYNVSRGIDLLLGADCFPLIMRNDLRMGIQGQPMAQATAYRIWMGSTWTNETQIATTARARPSRGGQYQETMR